MKKYLLLILISLSFWGCKSLTESDGKSKYLRWVGDIEYDEQLDNANFKVCNGEDDIIQYFNVGDGPVYSGEKSAILQTFQTNYKPVSDSNESGLIRIRFVVNCEGKAGRFRILQSGYDYQEREFDKKITTQLLEITKGIKNWKVLYEDDTPVDYYMYLIFKIKDGQIIEILP
ncbi:MAG: hypothetical protein AAF740_02020 [Bacteroidota bacterium]